MTKKSKFETAKELSWVYALVNGRLAEVYFDKPDGINSIFAHGYLNKTHVWENKKDKELMEKDIKRHCFTYRNGKYHPSKSIK